MTSIIKHQQLSCLSSLGALQKAERNNNEEGHTRKRFNFLPLFFSLGLHGALASFLFFPSQKVVESESIAIEVKWDKRSIIEQKDQTTCFHFLQCHPREGGDPEKCIATKQFVMDSRLRGNDMRKVNVKKMKSKARTSSEGSAIQRPPKLPYAGALTASNNAEGAKNKPPFSVAKIPILKKYARVSRKPLPKYPWICRKRGQEGSVSLRVQTNEEGQVINVSLYKSSGYAALDQSAITAVKAWVFADPACQKILSIAFHLKS